MLPFPQLCGISVLLLLMPLSLSRAQEAPTLVEHSDDSPVWISGQINVIHQQHPRFFAKYTGENSLRPERETATSRVLTLYLGVRVTKSTDVLVDLESAGGRGISNAFGLAGFTNLDVVRNPTLGSKPYLARLLFHHTVALGAESIPADRNFLSLMPEKPERRIEIYVGKLGIADQYLQLGGKGFLLGDGGLTYGRETILESYYTAHVIRGVFLSFDLQHVVNPGYNRDRGPVLVPGARVHVEF